MPVREGKDGPVRVCSLQVFPVGLRFRLRSGKISVLSAVGFHIIVIGTDSACHIGGSQKVRVRVCKYHKHDLFIWS